MSPDHLIDQMLPVAAALAVAVDGSDPSTVDDLLTTLSRHQLYALSIVLAAHIDPDRPFVRNHVATATKRAAHLAAGLFEIDVSAVLGDSRRREVLDARMTTYYAAHLLGESYSQIGRVMNRDHSSVINGVAKVGADPRLRTLAQQVAARLGWNREQETA